MTSVRLVIGVDLENSTNPSGEFFNTEGDVR